MRAQRTTSPNSRLDVGPFGAYTSTILILSAVLRHWILAESNDCSRTLLAFVSFGPRALPFLDHE